MAERNIDDLEAQAKIQADAKKADAAAGRSAKRADKVAVAVEAPRQAELVDVNYPEPTPIAKVVKDVARWSGQAFVMEPKLDAKIQIFAPQKLRPSQAYELFMASLSVLNLRAVKIGEVVKIVPSMRGVVGA